MAFAHLDTPEMGESQSAPASESVLANLDRIRAHVDSYLVPEDPALSNICEGCE